MSERLQPGPQQSAEQFSSSAEQDREGKALTFWNNWYKPYRRREAIALMTTATLATIFVPTVFESSPVHAATDTNQTRSDSNALQVTDYASTSATNCTKVPAVNGEPDLNTFSVDHQLTPYKVVRDNPDIKTLKPGELVKVCQDLGSQDIATTTTTGSTNTQDTGGGGGVAIVPILIFGAALIYFKSRGREKKVPPSMRAKLIERAKDDPKLQEALRVIDEGNNQKPGNRISDLDMKRAMARFHKEPPLEKGEPRVTLDEYLNDLYRND